MCKQEYLISTNDATDVTSAIEECLSTHGVCRLGSGVFYVHGVQMPKGSAIMGNGNASKLVLLPSLASGAAIHLNSFCTVKDLSVLGSEEPIDLPEVVGERHGILFQGDAKLENWVETELLQPRNATVTDCFISSFTGGGITCDDTGYYPACAIVSSNCHIQNCGAGINISYWSEFHKFTNILSVENLYGCINNGGNNTFVNCGFTSNKVGFLIDNSRKQSPNNSHGSAVGCTFHHSDHNEGIGILILGADHGYVFTGGHIGFSKIVIENSCGILFDGMFILRRVGISIKDGGLVAFTGCAFYENFDVSTENNDAVRVSNCYYRINGDEVKYPAP